MSRLANTIRMDYLAVLHPQAQVRLFARQYLPHTYRLRGSTSYRPLEITPECLSLLSRCRDP